MFYDPWRCLFGCDVVFFLSIVLSVMHCDVSDEQGMNAVQTVCLVNS